MLDKIIPYLQILILTLIVTGCSSQKDSFVNRLYHNTTARYNAYYLAKEKIEELELQFEKEYQEDYTQVLPVFFPIDSAVVSQNKELVEEAKEMASKAVDWHRISKWVDPSYLLIGKMDYYLADFDNAINTFKYLNVNSKHKDVRHLALIQLLRAFVDLEKFDDATYVIDFLSKEPAISKENKKYLYQTLAYFYEARGEQDMVIPALYQALENTDSKKEGSRMQFILGQLYQRIGMDALAYEYYQNSLLGNPPYERTFFAQLFSQQVAELERSKDLRRVRSYYDDLYKDRKNVDLRDVVLYERALFEIKQDELEEGISLLVRAAKEPGNNPRQKSYIYQKLAEIYLEEKNDYRATKFYLDSALQNLRETNRQYAELSLKKSVFDEYVANYDIIRNNDSLLAISLLSPEEQEALAEKFIQDEEARLIMEAEKADSEKTTGIFDNLLAFTGRSSGSTFYWENQTAMQRGAIEFARVWGNRTLEDNWRRSNRSFKDTSRAVDEETDEFLDEMGEEDAPMEDENESNLTVVLPEKEGLLKNIPNDEASKDRMKSEMEDAYFNLGKLLHFDLKEHEKSIEYLEKLIDTYPLTQKKPEAYYTLYLATKELGRSADKYITLLNTEFPDSQYSKSVNNPEQVSGNEANFESALVYKEAYRLYTAYDYESARSLTRKGLEEYPLTKNTERLLLLDIMIAGKLGDLSTYQTRLETYIQNAENTELQKMARNMLTALTGEREEERRIAHDTTDDNRPDSEADGDSGDLEATEGEEPPPYTLNKSLTHIFILSMAPQEASATKNLTADLENFHVQNFPNERLRTGTISLTRENTIVIISPFNNSDKAMAYKDQFLKSFNTEALSEEIKKSSFVISIENFQQLNKRKDIKEYKAFFNESYK